VTKIEAGIRLDDGESSEKVLEMYEEYTSE